MNTTETYGLTHIAVAVKNIKRTAEFYQKIFGMEIMYNESGFLQLTTPGTHDILVFEEKPTGQTGITGGITHFGFRLRDPDGIKSIAKKVKETGALVVDEGEFLPGSPYIFFKDPDGYEVEVWYELLP